MGKNEGNSSYVTWGVHGGIAPSRPSADRTCVKGMYDEAIAEYKKAIEINPNYARAHTNLVIAYYYKGEYGLAIKHCDKAIELGFKVQPKLLELLKPYREGLEKI